MAGFQTPLCTCLYPSTSTPTTVTVAGYGTVSPQHVCAVLYFSSLDKRRVYDGDAHNGVAVDVTVTSDAGCAALAYTDSTTSPNLTATAAPQTLTFTCTVDDRSSAASGLDVDLDPYLKHSQHDRLQLIVIMFIFVFLLLAAIALLLRPLFLILDERVRYYVLGWPIETTRGVAYAPVAGDRGDPAHGWCVRARSELSTCTLVLVALAAVPLAVLYVVGVIVMSLAKVSHGKGVCVCGLQ